MCGRCHIRAIMSCMNIENKYPSVAMRGTSIAAGNIWRVVMRMADENGP